MEKPKMTKPTWKVAVAGGVVAAAGLGGFAVAGADGGRPDVRSVELNKAELNASPVDDVLGSPSSVTVTVPPTTAAPAAPETVPPPNVSFDSAESLDSPAASVHDSLDSIDDSPDPTPAPAAADSVSVDSVDSVD